MSHDQVTRGDPLLEANLDDSDPAEASRRQLEPSVVVENEAGSRDRIEEISLNSEEGNSECVAYGETVGRTRGESEITVGGSNYVGGELAGRRKAYSYTKIKRAK